MLRYSIWTFHASNVRLFSPQYFLINMIFCTIYGHFLILALMTEIALRKSHHCFEFLELIIHLSAPGTVWFLFHDLLKPWIPRDTPSSYSLVKSRDFWGPLMPYASTCRLHNGHLGQQNVASVSLENQKQLFCPYKAFWGPEEVLNGPQKRLRRQGKHSFPHGWRGQRGEQWSRMYWYGSSCFLKKED